MCWLKDLLEREFYYIFFLLVYKFGLVESPNNSRVLLIWEHEFRHEQAYGAQLFMLVEEKIDLGSLKDGQLHLLHQLRRLYGSLVS